MEESTLPCCVRLRGLPWSASKEDIRKFLDEVCIEENGEAIIFPETSEGRRTGDALVLVASTQDLDKSLEYHKKFIGKRYVEVLKSSHGEYAAHAERSTADGSERVVRLRGLPYSATEVDVKEFLKGLDITPHGIVLLRDIDGRCSGDAYVEFFSADNVPQALQRHRQKIGNRFIEVYRSSKNEMCYMGSVQPTPLMSINCKPENSRLMDRRERELERLYEDDDGGYRFELREREYDQLRGDYYDDYRSGSNDPSVERYLHVRGLPYNCQEEDVIEFFYPLELSSIGFCYGQDRRFNGECDVYFVSSHDCMLGLRRDKQRIGKRYVEIFMRTRKICNVRQRRRRSFSRESVERVPPPPLSQQKQVQDYPGAFGASPTRTFSNNYASQSPVPPAIQHSACNSSIYESQLPPDPKLVSFPDPVGSQYQPSHMHSASGFQGQNYYREQEPLPPQQSEVDSIGTHVHGHGQMKIPDPTVAPSVDRYYQQYY